MAAFQNIMNKKVEEYNKIIEDINLINTQVEHLGTNKTITDQDKSELRNFYMDRLKFNERKRKILLASKEVRNALRVEFEEVSATVKK